MKRDSLSQVLDDGIASEIAILSPEKRALFDLRCKERVYDGHTIIARTLKALGVTHIYAVSGTPVDQTLAACALHDIRQIGVRHQQAGVMMALAHNYTAGGLRALSIVSAGPAVTNAVTGVLVARDNAWPLIVLGGRRPVNMRDMGSFQELDGVSIFQSITKWSATVDTIESLPGMLARAYATAITGRPGPVYLDITEDVLFATMSEQDILPLASTMQAECKLDTAMISQAANILLTARRPALIIGKGIRWSEPYDELKCLVDDIGIPFISSPMGSGYLPDSHPLCFNDASGTVQSSADVVVLLGARLDWTFRFGAELGKDVKLIQVDIQPGEIGRNIQPSIGIVGDVKVVLDQLLTLLKDKKPVISKTWLDKLNRVRDKRRRKLEIQAHSETLPMSPHRMLKEIRDVIPGDAIIILDGNVIMAAAQQMLPAFLPASRFTAGSNGCMGVGIPFGIGANLSNPGRPVIVICGDTAFGFNAMELETAIRYRVPLIVIVANNDGNMGSLKQNAYYPEDYPERVTMFLDDIRYERIIGAFGGRMEHVEVPDDIKPAVKRAISAGKATCINIKVDPDAAYPGR